MSNHSQYKHSHSIYRGIGLLVLWNAALLISNLWKPYWGIAVLVSFILYVYIVSQIGNTIPLKYKKAYDRFLAISFPFLVLLVWEVIVQAGLLNPRWFPPPSQILEGMWDLTVNYDRFNKTSLLGRPWLIPEQFNESGWDGVESLFNESHVYITLVRVLVGFALGAIPGIIVGLIMGINHTVRIMLDSTLSAIYVLPKIAIFPIMMLVFPDPFGEGPKIAVVALSAFFLVAINTMAGVQNIDPVYLQAGKNYGANNRQMFWHVIFPGALPVIFSGLRLALGTGLIVIVAVEFVRAKVGVGRVIIYHWEILSVNKMYAGLVVTMILGILLTYILQLIEKRVMPWRE